MAEIRTVTTLKGKRDEITRAIVNYENKIAQAKVDLAHINAAIRIFEIGEDGPTGDAQHVAPYVDIYRMFKRGEMVAICKAALAKGPMNTRQLSAVLLNAKGLDASDKVLAKAISYRLIHALRIQARSGKLVGMGRDKAARVWALPAAAI
jgi:hypothetical protein